MNGGFITVTACNPVAINGKKSYRVNIRPEEIESVGQSPGSDMSAIVMKSRNCHMVDLPLEELEKHIEDATDNARWADRAPPALRVEIVDSCTLPTRPSA